MILSPAGKQLWKLLGSAEGWSMPSRYALLHEPSGTSWWIANGAWFFDGDDIRGTMPCLGLFERHILWRRAKNMRNLVMAKKLSPPQNDGSKK